MKTEVRPYRERDEAELLPRVRQPDIDECEALFGVGSLSPMLGQSIRRSILTWAYTVDDEVAAVFGVAPATSMMGSDGLPWLVGTPLIDKSRSAFVKQSRLYIPKMLAAFPRLVNVVDVRNVKSIAWLKRMGFTVLEPITLGVMQKPFHPFFKE